MEPEVKLIEQLRERALWLESRSFVELHGDIEREAADEIERLQLLLDQHYRHTQQPVDWPTKPGWWWMKRSRYTQPELVEFDGHFIATADGYSEPGEVPTARFLPAHVPTFSPHNNESGR